MTGGSAIRYSIEVGDPAETIVQYAREKNCDQILMGTQGMGSLSGFVMGSVASKVVHLSPVPVLLTKKRGPAVRAKPRTST